MSHPTLGWTATAATVTLFSSYVQLIRDVRDAGTTAGKNPHVFGGMLFNCAWWLAYGALKADRAILACNGLGGAIALAGAGTFLQYASTSEDANYCRKLYGGVVGTAAGVLMAGHVALPAATLMSLVGFVAMSGSVVLFASPLTELKQMLAKKDASNLSPFIIFFSVVATTLWTLYGVLAKDAYIALPNGIGLGLSLVQAGVYWQYGSQGGVKGRGGPPGLRSGGASTNSSTGTTREF